MDDVWISGHLTRKNISKWLVGGVSSKCVPSKMPKGDFDSLKKIPLDRYLANDQVIQHFKDEWSGLEVKE